MTYPVNKAEFGGYIYKQLMQEAVMGGQGANVHTDGMRLIMMMSGIMVETLLLFDDPEEGLVASYKILSEKLNAQPKEGMISDKAIPPAYILDYETEQGRALAKKLFEEWLDCVYEFHDLMIFIVHNIILKLEEEGQPRTETFRLYVECLNKAMAYEVSAQELCDVVIDEKIGRDGWNLCDSVSGLSAIAGRRLALSHNACELFATPTLPDKLDQISYVMTQEAIRLGIPAGSDWRYGLAANDYFTSAPYDLIFSLEPRVKEFFRVIEMPGLLDQSVACAKAAGRMLAVAAGGEEPEVEPTIAKPLAMGAMIDTYKTVCREEAIVSC